MDAHNRNELRGTDATCLSHRLTGLVACCLTGLISLALMASCSSLGRPLASSVLSPKIPCASLTGVKIAANSIGLPTNGATVTSATLVAATPQTVDQKGSIVLPVPEYCKIEGAIAPIDPNAPPINFQVSLPTTWNDRSMHFGGAGMNGRVTTGVGPRYPQPPNDPWPISRGYATFGGDSGHTGGNTLFGLNDEALRNFAFESMKKTRDSAFELIRRYYGKLPRYNYFSGESEGGREGHAVTQRFPADYDGVIAYVPIISLEGTHIHDNAVLTALANGGWMNKNKIKLIADSTLAACDELDGLKDGIISKYGTFDPTLGWHAACAHDVSALRCPDGKDTGDTCLSDAQITAVEVIRDPFVLPFRLVSGSTGYIGYGAMGGENDPVTWDTAVIGSAPPVKPQPPGPTLNPGVGGVGALGFGNVRYFVAQNPSFQTYNFDPIPYEKRIQYLSSLMDYLDPDISAYKERGGKLIIIENSCDYHRSMFLGMNYYKALLDRFGPSATEAFARLYVAVGANHFGANAPSQADFITLIENWVEKGEAPSKNVVAVQMNPATFKVLRSRPMCGYGMYPRYNGSGDPNEASSFTCTPL